MTRSWFITTTTYGTWLPGDTRGFTDNEHHGLGEQPAPPNSHLQSWALRQLQGGPIRLNDVQSRLLLNQFHDTAEHRGWRLHAVAVLANHCHLVLSAPESVKAEDIVRDLKSYGSRRLNQEFGKPQSGTWWTESASRRPLEQSENVEAAVRYVAEQSYPLALWVQREFEWLVPEVRRDALSDVLPGGLRPPLRVEEAGGLTPPARKTDATLRQLDNDHVWHPFTAMSAYRDEDAPIIVDAEGFFLIDSTGRRYLDGHSSLWCNIHGHRVPAIDAAIRAQLDRVAHTTLLGLSNQPSIELAAELVRRAPAGLSKVFYADCGAAGVEVALKLAFQYHRQKATGREERNLFACLGRAYHGDTVGTISLGGIDRFHSLFGSLMFPALRIPTPPADQSIDIEGLDRLLAEHAHQLAGFVIEPLVQAAAGILVHPPGYLKVVRELTRKYGILLIADEIAVGFGRTGRMFACEHEDVSPDILILSKGLTGGYLPLAATLVTDEIESAFLGDPWEGRTFQHGHTYTGNPLACAAALASLQLLDDNKVMDNAQTLESALRHELGVLMDPRNSETAPIQKHVAAVRQRGVMVGIELVQDRSTGTPFPASRRTGHLVTLACRRRGVVLRNIGDTIVLMPAPAMPAELGAHLCRVVIESLVEVLEAG